MRRILLPLLLVACRPEAQTGDAWISPVDGKTDLPLDAPLRVHVGGLQLPPDYPVGQDFIRVVDVEEGGFVPGRVVIDRDVVTFFPDAYWQPGRHYVWSIGEMPRLDRAPEHEFPESLYGEAVFATTHDIEVLDLTIHGGGLVCAVLSRHLDAITDRVTATLDDHPIDVGQVMLHGEAQWIEDAPPELLEHGVTVACFPDLPADAGASLRVWWGPRPPFQSRLESRDVRELLFERRRVH